MSRIHFLAGLLALGMAVGCKAQPSTQGTPDLTQNRRIEVMVRSQFNLPPDIAVTLGARKPSQISGYDALPVTLSHGAKSQVVEFLISTDGKTLARLEKFDLANDPLFSIDVAGRPIRGNPAAKVTVISFDDLECPYCARMHQTLFPATLERYKDKVRFIYKDYPLPRNAPLGHARRGGRQLPGRAERRGLLDLRGLPPLPRPGDQRRGPEPWPRALPRWIASPARRPRWANSTPPSWTPALPNRTKPRCAPR